MNRPNRLRCSLALGVWALLNRPAFRADPTDEIRSFSRRGVGWEPAFNPFFLKAEPRGLPFAANFSFPRCHRPEPTLTNVYIHLYGIIWYQVSVLTC